MASPDAEDPLAYLDAGELMALLDSDELWPLFEEGLLPRVRWRGAADSLMAVRHRSAHCRRPHRDDLSRLEQVLRDLEPGARRTLEAFNEQRRIWSVGDDPVIQAWVGKGHDDAQRLVDHARDNYGTDFELRWSRRLWAAEPAGQITGQKGLVWHVEWHVRDQFIDLKAFWRGLRQNPGSALSLVTHVVQTYPSNLSVAIPAVCDADLVSDTIGLCFDTLMHALIRNASEQTWDRWADGLAGLDPRVHVNSVLSLATPDAVYSVFSAG